MESSRRCYSCGGRALVSDDVSGNTVCSSCGVVQEFDNFEVHIGGINGPVGTFVRMGTAGIGSVLPYKEKKIFEAQKLIDDYMLRLGLSGTKSREVKVLIEKVTEGEYGEGNWFPVLIGACAYVVMRMDQKVFPVVQIADVVGCDVYELGRMISRVVSFTSLILPEFDIVNSFERAIKSCPSFSDVSEDVIRRMLKQGVFLVQCLIKWFVTTGRRPMPVVAAVVVFVAELNEIEVKIEDVATKLHSAISTCKRRYREILERLVKVAQVLPWGKDVNMKNIVKNAPFVIQYMEMKSMEKYDGDKQSLEHIPCLSIDSIHGFDDYNVEDCASQYFKMDHEPKLICPPTDRLQISSESLSIVYSSFLDEMSAVKATAGISKENRRKRTEVFDFYECSDWWNGQSDMSKKLYLKQILEKDVGLDPPPPSFESGCLAREKRRTKITAAKLRIERTLQPKLANSKQDSCALEPGKSKKKRKKTQLEDIDWEDLTIETLLLHKVKEEEIENAHSQKCLGGQFQQVGQIMQVESHSMFADMTSDEFMGTLMLQD